MFEVIKKLFLGTVLMFATFGLLCIIHINLFKDFIDWDKDAGLKTIVLISVIFGFQVFFLIHFYFSLYLFAVVESIEEKIRVKKLNFESSKYLSWFSALLIKAKILHFLFKKRKMGIFNHDVMKESQSVITFISLMLIILVSLLIACTNYWCSFFIILLIAIKPLLSVIHFILINEVTRYRYAFAVSKDEASIPNINVSQDFSKDFLSKKNGRF